MKILSIETSCDETGVAIVDFPKVNILADVVASQISVHEEFGGVVPNLAQREHAQNIVPCLEAAFSKAKIDINEFDAIGVTQGPGLLPALLMGMQAARTLAYLSGKPIYGVNHCQAHIYANFLSLEEVSAENLKKYFPAVALIVSGGHTELFYMKNLWDFKILGTTRDDAAGECLDKTARLLGLGYPGGPLIEKEARIFQKGLEDGLKEKRISLPRPMINSKDYDFSFSGLKTAVLYALKDAGLSEKAAQEEFSFEIQESIIDVLVAKAKKAVAEKKVKALLLGGGVTCNERLRERFTHEFFSIPVLIPNKKQSQDNGAMIAVATYLKSLKNRPDDLFKLAANANLD